MYSCIHVNPWLNQAQRSEACEETLACLFWKVDYGHGVKNINFEL